MSPYSRLLPLVLGMVAIAACENSATTADSAVMDSRIDSRTRVVVATGLDNPRGITFGRDGYLYVAEAGVGGGNSTVGQCPQVPFPFGPYTGGLTGRVSRIDADGLRTTVVQGLPSSLDNPIVGGNVLGPADLEFVDGTLYVLIAGGGCSSGNAGTTNGIVKVDSHGNWSQVTDHSAFLHSHQVAVPDSGDIAQDGSPYSMVHRGSVFYVVEANQAQLLAESLDGGIDRILDITQTFGNITPTAIALGHNGAVIGNLGNVPFLDGTAVVFDVRSGGALGRVRPGFTAVLGLERDQQGRLYALETSTSDSGLPPFLFPNSGRVVRVDEAGPGRVIAMGLNLPTAMTFGPDGALYVTACGYGCGPGGGSIIRITP